MKHVRLRAAMTAAAALLTAGLAAGTASAAPAIVPLHCEASALRASGIGFADGIEPAVVGRTGPCANVAFGALPALPAAVQASVLASTTYDSAKKAGTATGGVASLKVVPTPDLLAQLPTQQAIDALQPIAETLTVALGPLQLPTPLPVLLDVRGALQGLATPPDSLLSADLISAHATVACQAGVPKLAGSSQLTGVRVAGVDLPADGVLNQAITLIGAQSIPLGTLDPSKIVILDPLTQAPLVGTLLTATTAALASTIATFTDTIALPATTLDVAIAPGGQLVENGRLTQRALTAKLDLGGIHVLDATLGEAVAGDGFSFCTTASTTTPGTTTTPSAQGGVDAITATGSVADQILACSDRKLVLVDVLRSGNRVKILGAANRDYAGRQVAIRLRATHRIVAHALVQRDGSFQTTAPLPPARYRTKAKADLVRYSAEIAREHSLPLKLQRRMIVSSMTSKNGKVTIAGRVLPPLTSPATEIRLVRRLSCKKEALVKRFKPGADGRFRITVPAPEGQVAAVYRLMTRVRATRHNPKRFPTFTLPRGVALNTR